MAISVTMNRRFKILFTLQDSKEHVVNYTLNNTLLAQKWFDKIKHLRNIPIDETISQLDDVSDIAGIYKELCSVADIEPIRFDNIDQDLFNKLHQIYEDNHDRVAAMQDNRILYKFHQAIHYNEVLGRNRPKRHIVVGWGVKEGPLTHKFNCGDYNDDHIRRNNLYLQWSELGKTPLEYWRNQEPNDQARFNTLAKPHITFRAKFSIALEDRRPSDLDPKFLEWFDQYKEKWLAHHGVQKWDKIDEYCSPLLASTEDTIDLSTARFHRIELVD